MTVTLHTSSNEVYNCNDMVLPRIVANHMIFIIKIVMIIINQSINQSVLCYDGLHNGDYCNIPLSERKNDWMQKKKWSFRDDARTTLSSSAFQILAAATGMTRQRVSLSRPVADSEILKGGGRQRISPVVICRKFTQRPICLLYRKIRFNSKKILSR